MTFSQETILVTGCTGFIAKHIVLRLVEGGAHVRGTLRDPARAKEIHQLLDAAGLPRERFEAIVADLERDGGWRGAAQGCRFVLHTASPFPAAQPRDKFALVPPARDGAVRALTAAKEAGAQRVVMTSSVAAIFYGHGRDRSRLFTERDVSDVDSPNISPYAVSKTEAEKAAWETLAGSSTELVTINPSLVFGPLLDARLGTSASIVRMMSIVFVPVSEPTLKYCRPVSGSTAVWARARSSTRTFDQRRSRWLRGAEAAFAGSASSIVPPA